MSKRVHFNEKHRKAKEHGNQLVSVELKTKLSKQVSSSSFEAAVFGTRNSLQVSNRGTSNIVYRTIALTLVTCARAHANTRLPALGDHATLAYA